jgi:hypothetical protein
MINEIMNYTIWHGLSAAKPFLAGIAAVFSSWVIGAQLEEVFKLIAVGAGSVAAVLTCVKIWWDIKKVKEQVHDLQEQNNSNGTETNSITKTSDK